MTEISAPISTLPFIPDNLTIPQFILDAHHPSRPLRKDGMPWLIEDESGREIGVEEVNRLIKTFIFFSYVSLAPCSYLWFGEFTEHPMEYP